MPVWGQYARLKILKTTPQGLYLESPDTGTWNEILLPAKEVTPELQIGDYIEVFLYKDSDSRPVATLKKAKLLTGQIGALKVMDVNQYGAFLDWGVDNQILLPFAEQRYRVAAGEMAVVVVEIDPVTDRLIASMKVERHIEKKVQPEDALFIKPGADVTLYVYDTEALAFVTVMKHDQSDIYYRAYLYRNEVFQPVRKGDVLEARIKNIREDGKIDVTVQKSGREARDEGRDKILEYLGDHLGFLPLTDDSSPEEIKDMLGISKKTFKRSVGTLLKEGRIELQEKGVAVSEQKSQPAGKASPAKPPHLPKRP